MYILIFHLQSKYSVTTGLCDIWSTNKHNKFIKIIIKVNIPVKSSKEVEKATDLYPGVKTLNTNDVKHVITDSKIIATYTVLCMLYKEE